MFIGQILFGLVRLIGGCKVKFPPPGVKLRIGSKLIVRYKKYPFDKSRSVNQLGMLDGEDGVEKIPDDGFII